MVFEVGGSIIEEGEETEGREIEDRLEIWIRR